MSISRKTGTRFLTSKKGITVMQREKTRMNAVVSGGNWRYQHEFMDFYKLRHTETHTAISLYLGVVPCYVH